MIENKDDSSCGSNRLVIIMQFIDFKVTIMWCDLDEFFEDFAEHCITQLISLAR